MLSDDAIRCLRRRSAWRHGRLPQAPFFGLGGALQQLHLGLRHCHELDGLDKGGQALTWGDAAKGIYPEVVLFNLNVASAVAEATNNDFHALPSTAGMAGKVQVMSFGRGTGHVQIEQNHLWINALGRVAPGQRLPPLSSPSSSWQCRSPR